MLELLSEPFYILAAVQLRFRLRAVTDTCAIVAKSAVAVALLRWTTLPPALALSLSQVTFAVVTLLLYTSQYVHLMPDWLGLGRSNDSRIVSRSNRDPLIISETGGTILDLPPDQSDHSCDQSCGSENEAMADAIGGSSGANGRAETENVEGAAGKITSRHHTDSTASGIRRRFQAELLPLKARRGQQQQRQSQEPAMRYHTAPSLHLPTLRLCGTFTLQAAEKLVLAEGSKMVMVAQPPATQGVYGLVTNLGALVVRTAFQPFEEAAFTAFSTSTDRHSDVKMLAVLVRGASVLGLFAAGFGPANSWLALRLLYSLRWASTAAPAALGAYCPYILLLAVNGILEAFVHATSNSRQLNAINLALVAFAGCHVGLSNIMVQRAGAIGLIGADCVNMAARIAFSAILLSRLTANVSSFSLRSLYPSRTTLVAMIAAFWVTGVSALVTLGPEAAGPVPSMLMHALMLSNPSWLIGSTQSMGNMHLLRDASFFVQAATQIAVSSACLITVLFVVFRSERLVWSTLMTMKQK